MGLFRRKTDGGDPTSAEARFHELVWPHRAAVLRLALLLTHDHAEADDLAQETLIKAFRGIDRFQPGTDVKAWLYAILRNARTDRIRSRASSAGEVSLSQFPVEPSDPDPTSDADLEGWAEPQDLLNRFSDQQVIAALQSLPEEIRWTLLLVDVEGLDQSEAAQVLHVPVGTIKSRAHRGRGMLRQALLSVAKEMRLIR